MHRITVFIICLYSFIMGLRKKKAFNKTVILLFFGRIGDGVMFLDALDEYKKLYSQGSNYRMIFACRDEVKTLLKAVARDSDIEFIEIDRDRLSNSFRYFTSRVRRIAAFSPEMIIHVRENSAIENVLIHAITAKEKIIYRSFQINYDSWIKKYYSLNTYTIDIQSDQTNDQLTNYICLLRALGTTHIESKIPHIHLGILVDDLPERYIVVCPGGSSKSKCWPLAWYAEILDYCMERYTEPIVVCGGKGEIDAAQKIAAFMDIRTQIINKAGKTSIAEWIACIQGADLVITNESASVHIAASTGVPSICIGEQTYGDMWLPYRPEQIKSTDRNPIVIRTEMMDCAFCAKREFRISKACNDCIQSHGVKKCIYDITPNMVKKTLESYYDQCYGNRQ